MQAPHAGGFLPLVKMGKTCSLTPLFLPMDDKMVLPITRQGVSDFRQSRSVLYKRANCPRSSRPVLVLAGLLFYLKREQGSPSAIQEGAQR
ncbi:hypothetical protein IEQ34_023458 [Dendrobium chrysotoxum]|uniref:Uncharacterized protein n=1 Tax=Dendrobium chrysotoxum TaxID=161865 RepID=A0AAV7FNL7_DENCH|nr:hypothetical protein IEQ34_025845 [Dendrobium chrysotoxum]KAH0439568.1 hypothetical protein IEQ34_025851 [Dendrobium chrysotoxum]KAH0447656.1 hypothetical protein IEQ34_023515 [Dendrobium chrysotoxum]KAH0447699.1 hypothetical protein IEQ34_023458 [Dendrobium chrysotoxum]